MDLTINGEKETLTQDGLTVTELLKAKNVDMPDMVSVELNGEILEREAFGKTQVKSGDEVEFLYFMGGGAVERNEKLVI
ncbi:MAG: sulfur carrier protein [Candidatus Marinamargulisbacteria bacterium]|jgi:sulfur carrier protein